MAKSQATQTAEAPPQQPPPGTIERIRPRALSQRDPGGLARNIANSGFWSHIKTPAQAMVVMAAGEELGLTPLASIQGITIIEGKIGYTAALIATLIKQHPVYGYRVLAKTNEKCTLQFLEDGEPCEGDEEGKFTFTIKDAQRAKLIKSNSNWEKWPRPMCFSRCLTEGSRAYFPDLTAGTPVYTDEEIREVIHVPAEVEQVADAEVVTEPERERLSDEVLDKFMQGYAIASTELGGTTVENGHEIIDTPIDGLNIMLGSLGFDALEVGAEGGVREQVAHWSPEQVEAVETEFQKAVDRAAQKAASGEGEPVDAEAATDGEEAENADG